jgi:hypothetical protein
MPVILPFIPLIAAGIGAAGTGLAIDQALNQPSAPKVSTTPPPLTSTQNASQTAAVGQQLPTLQSLTGGSLSPEYYAQYGGTQAGVGNDPRATGNIQDAVSQFFGLAAPGATGLNPTANSPAGGPGITSLTQPQTSAGGGAPDLMNLLRGNGTGNWIQSVLNGNNFSGLQQGG